MVKLGENYQRIFVSYAFTLRHKIPSHHVRDPAFLFFNLMIFFPSPFRLHLFVVQKKNSSFVGSTKKRCTRKNNFLWFFPFMKKNAIYASQPFSAAHKTRDFRQGILLDALAMKGCLKGRWVNMWGKNFPRRMLTTLVDSVEEIMRVRFAPKCYF